MRQWLAPKEPGRAFSTELRVGGALAAVNIGRRDIGHHRRNLIGKQRAQEQDELAAARLSGDRDETLGRSKLAAYPVQSLLEIFQVRIGNVGRKSRRGEIAERQRRITP